MTKLELCRHSMIRSGCEACDLTEDVERLERERDEAREAIAWANNSLFGSQGFFLTTNGGENDKHHLDRAIERLKADARHADRERNKAERERDALRAALRAIRDELADQLPEGDISHAMAAANELLGEDDVSERHYDCIVRQAYISKVNGKPAIVNADRRFIIAAESITDAMRAAEAFADSTAAFGPKYVEFRCTRAASVSLPFEVST